jgi:hypothetical protein
VLVVVVWFNGLPMERRATMECKECQDPTKKIKARGMCKSCYDKWYFTNKGNPDVKFRTTKKAKVPSKPYPIPHVVTVWECSDGREFSGETEALRYELDLFRRG